MVTATALFCVMTAVHAVEKTPPPILPAPPGRPDVKARYLFYLHGRIVQEQGRKAVSPEYGRYEYDAILRGFAGAGFVVVSEVRPRRMNASVYADRVVRQIRRLLDARVPARSITVVGASMGGYIAMRVSSRVSDPHVGYAIMGLCGDDTLDLGDGLHGDFLSLFEASDELGRSCAPLFARAGGLSRHAEIRLDTGLRHGFLYRPLSEWMDPVIRWARERGSPASGPSPAREPFVTMARQSPCADVRNRLHVIDDALVFWQRVGRCVDNGYASVLFGNAVDDVRCSIGDSIAGPLKSCRDPHDAEMFEILINHSDQPDLGLGPGHSVKPLPLGGDPADSDSQTGDLDVPD
jgi:hypothetical protein